MPTKDDPIVLEDVEIIFRNFSGRQTLMNAAGDRNFCVLLTDRDAARLIDRGMNVKTLKPKEEGDEGRPFLKVKVNFAGNRPPKVFMITSRGRTALTEDQVEMLDWVDITKVDLIINPYHWVMPGKTGVSAYLKSLFVTIEEDELDLKYAGVPDASMPPLPQVSDTED